MPVDRTLPCIKCNKRKRTRANGTCTPCNALIRAEKTHDLYGIAKETPQRQRLRERANEYNRLARSGMQQKEIAAAWGMSQTQLSSFVYRAKKHLKMKMVNLAEVIKGHKPKATKEIRRFRNEHGGGNWGKRNCKCEPCKRRKQEAAATYRATLPKETKAAYNKAHRERQKRLKQQQNNSDVTQETMPS